ncbi:MAG: hypothetical protein U0354_02235 [Candidatus Sericytochromatia bacterium]
MSRDISVNSIANEIMSQYDRNKNGQIDYRGNRSEATRSESASSYDGENLNFSSSRMSREKLFYAADSNNDGKVTREELVNTIKQYDKNNDGQLTQTGFVDWVKSKFGGEKKVDEFSPFDREYGEKRNTSYVSVPVNPKPTYPSYPSYPSGNDKPVSHDPFSNNKPSSGGVSSDPFSNNKPSNNKPVSSDPFSNNKPSSGGNKPVSSDPFSSGNNNKPVSSDPFSSKPSSGSGSKPTSSDPFKR